MWVQILLSTVIDQITSDLRPLLLFSAGAASKELAVQRDFIPAIQSLIPINLKPKTRLLMRFYKGVDRLWLFTKNPNPNKLYVDNRLNMFLSSGIVLRFMNLKGGRFMKKRLRVWYGYIKAMQLLQTNPFVLNFKDLFGKKTILLSKLRNSGIRVA